MNRITQLMKKAILFFLILACVAPNLEAQTLKAFLTAAEEATQDKDFYNALYYYQEATEFDTTNLEIRNKYGLSAQAFNAFTIAEREYQFIVDNDESNTYPLATYHLGTVQQKMGSYDDAKRNFELFLSETEGEQFEMERMRAEKEIEAIEWAIENQENPVQGIEVSHLENGVNTPYSDFGAVKKNDELYFSSLRFDQKDQSNTKKLYSKILTEGDVDSMTMDADQDNNRSNEAGEKESANYTHEAHTSFTKDGSRMYYTLCEYLNSLDIRCDIYVRDVMDGNTSKKGTKLPTQINNTASTNTQPNIAYDIDGNEILYFVSDREGGKGGLDIWYSRVNNNEYSEPINLDVANTTSNEVTPFFHSNSNTLYFSSDGYMGMGGYDIFETVMVEDEFTTPVNLRAPRNTSFNDLYYTLNDEGTEAYFSSNRVGSLYLEEGFEACCYDIYKADIEEIEVDYNAITFDGLTQEDLLGARVRIFDAVTGELLHEQLNDLGNDHKFKLKCGKQYTIITDAAGYESDTTSLNLKQCDKPITKKLYLSPIEGRLDVLTFFENEETALNGATVTLYNLSDPDAAPIVITDLDKNLSQFDIIGGREYKIVAEKKGYQTKEITFKAIDFSNGVLTKKIIFDKTVINLNEYLPVAVYFDNDRPDQRTRTLYTAKSYSDTYYPYIEKQQEFKTKYTANMRGDTKSNAEYEIDNFFDVEVKGGYQRMRLFMDKLVERLQMGEIIELSLKGFASPKAANKYNLALGQRRIWTLKNELLTHGGGILKPFVDSGKLQVLEISYGEEASPKDISDSYSNRRLSVYSVEASKQRKAEIVRIRVIN